MTGEGDQGQGNSEGTPVRDTTDESDSQPPSTTPARPPEVSRAEDPPHQHADGGAAARAEPTENRRRKKRRGNVPVHLQAIGLIAAIVAIPLAYWQGSEQSSQGEFEKNQRVRELALDLAVFWETQLDPETRYLVGRFVAKLKSLPNDEERHALVRALLDHNNLLDSDTIVNKQENRQLYELIKPDLGSPHPNVPAMTPVMAVARYKAAVMRVLNTMEAIAIVREYSEGFPQGQEVIDRAYSGAIRQQYHRLKPFLHEYRRQNGGRRRPAWERLIKMLDEDGELLMSPPAVVQH